MPNKDLRQMGLKVTTPRVKILQILENSTDRHLRPEDIYRALLDSGVDVGLATIYRVLTQFEAAGIVTRHHFESGLSVFELNEGAHHDHVVCIRCGKVTEFIDEIIEERQRQIVANLGMKMTAHSLIIYGICKECEGKE